MADGGSADNAAWAGLPGFQRSDVLRSNIDHRSPFPMGVGGSAGKAALAMAMYLEQERRYEEWERKKKACRDSLKEKKKACRVKRRLRQRAKAANVKSSRGEETCTTLEPKQGSRDSDVKQEDEEEGEECPGLEPFFFDEAEAVAEHMERTRMVQEEERRLQRKEAALRKIREYDPKLGEICSTRIDFVDLGKFDLDEESPLGPMRHTDAAIDMVNGIFIKERKNQFLSAGAPSVNVKDAELYKPPRLVSVKFDPSSHVGFRVSGPFFPCHADGEELYLPCDSANFLSVKIVSSDVGFPINVYGTVIARDMLDRKCVYLFRCDRDHSHLILTKEDKLTLTGPKRGLALIDAIYIEIDLKIKGAGKQKEDKQLSKGCYAVNPVRVNSKDESSFTFDSRLSAVMVMYAVERSAVEATITIEVVQGKFCGEVTACTTNTRDTLLLYDTKLMSAQMTGIGVIPLLRRIVAVGLKEKLIVTIARLGVCKADRGSTIKFTPRVNDRDEAVVTCGSVKMLVKVAWSIISRCRSSH